MYSKTKQKTSDSATRWKSLALLPDKNQSIIFTCVSLKRNLAEFIRALCDVTNKSKNMRLQLHFKVIFHKFSEMMVKFPPAHNLGPTLCEA